MKNKSVDEFFIDVLNEFKKDKRRILRRLRNVSTEEGAYVEIPFITTKICLARFNAKSRKFVRIEILYSRNVRIIIRLV